ncbi:MAG: hypothetical protein ACI9WU_001888 [Myxococcota bacterium]
MSRNIRLEGDERDAYVVRATRLLGDSRVNRSFVPPAELGRLFGHLAPMSGLDARPFLEIDSLSGLPTLPEFLRARARTVALDDGPGLERFRIDARVRHQHGGNKADLRIIVDRFDPARSLFRRADLEISARGCRDITIASERAALSGELQDTLFRFATADPGLLLLRLADVKGIEPHGVTLGITGPLLFAGIEVPEELSALGPLVRHADPQAMVLCCRLERLEDGEAEPVRRRNTIIVGPRDKQQAIRSALPAAVVYPA